jgi:hypothetical protein
MGMPKAHSRSVSDPPLRLFGRGCARALSARPSVCPCALLKGDRPGSDSPWIIGGTDGRTQPRQKRLDHLLRAHRWVEALTRCFRRRFECRQNSKRVDDHLGSALANRPIGLESFSYPSCVFLARSASVSHRSAISMKNDLCAEVQAACANRMHSAALLRN